MTRSPKSSSQPFSTDAAEESGAAVCEMEVAVKVPADEDHCGHAQSGYGNCSVCACTAFMGNDTLCGNCQHNYNLHN